MSNKPFWTAFPRSVDIYLKTILIFFLCVCVCVRDNIPLWLPVYFSVSCLARWTLQLVFGCHNYTQRRGVKGNIRIKGEGNRNRVRKKLIINPSKRSNVEIMKWNVKQNFDWYRHSISLCRFSRKIPCQSPLPLLLLSSMLLNFFFLSLLLLPFILLSNLIALTAFHFVIQSYLYYYFYIMMIMIDDSNSNDGYNNNNDNKKLLSFYYFFICFIHS